MPLGSQLKGEGRQQLAAPILPAAGEAVEGAHDIIAPISHPTEARSRVDDNRKTPQRSAGLRPSRLGGVAHAWRQTALQLDDSPVRPGEFSRLARQSPAKRPLGRNARGA